MKKLQQFQFLKYCAPEFVLFYFNYDMNPMKNTGIIIVMDNKIEI